MSASFTCAEDPAHEIRQVARLYESVHGLKRGRGLLAERAGMSDRRLRALLFERARPYADEWLAVQAAQMVVRRERAAAIRAELEALEQELPHGGDADTRVDSRSVGDMCGDSGAAGGLCLVGGPAR